MANQYSNIFVVHTLFDTIRFELQFMVIKINCNLFPKCFRGGGGGGGGVT